MKISNFKFQTSKFRVWSLVFGTCFEVCILMFGFCILPGCGGSPAAPVASPEASISPFVSKIVVFEPAWPADLAAAVARILD